MPEKTLCEKGICLLSSGRVVPFTNQRTRICRELIDLVVERVPNFPVDDCPFAALNAAYEAVMADRQGDFDAAS